MSLQRSWDPNILSWIFYHVWSAFLRTRLPRSKRLVWKTYTFSYKNAHCKSVKYSSNILFRHSKRLISKSGDWSWCWLKTLVIMLSFSIAKLFTLSSFPCSLSSAQIQSQELESQLVQLWRTSSRSLKISHKSKQVLPVLSTIDISKHAPSKRDSSSS